MTNLGRINADIYQNGTAVFMMDGKAEYVEEFVQKVAKLSDQRVDWHYMGGRAVVMALGDVDKVRDIIRSLIPDLAREYNTRNQYSDSRLKYTIQQMQNLIS